MKASKIVVFFGGILLIGGLSFGQPIQESLRGEGLNGLNQKIAKIAVNGKAMLDENKDGIISKTEFKEDLEKLEAGIGLGGEDLTILNEKMAKIAVKGELMLDENKDGKLSETDIKKDLEILEAKIGV